MSLVSIKSEQIDAAAFFFDDKNREELTDDEKDDERDDEIDDEKDDVCARMVDFSELRQSLDVEQSHGQRKEQEQEQEQRHEHEYEHEQNSGHTRDEAEDVSDENIIPVETDRKSERIMFKDYYKIIGMNDRDVAAVCRSCKLIQYGSANSVTNFQRHLEVNDV